MPAEREVYRVVSEETSLTGEVSAFIAAASTFTFPPQVIERAKEAMVDGLAVMLAGSRTPGAALLRGFYQDMSARGGATLVGSGGALPASMAAAVNGLSGHADDYDDTQISSQPDRVYGLLTHPTTPVLAASLAVAEEQGATGDRLLEAFITGVEVECKMAEAISPRHYTGGFHSTGTFGVFGAAAAAARLLRLSAGECRHAIGIAASKSAGIRAAFGTMTKPYHAGAAAESGVVAARLAGQGFRTDPDALDGSWGFFQVAGGGCDPALIQGRLGNPFSLVDPGVSIKPYPCGSLAHPSMDALAELVWEHDVLPEQVEEVRLGTSSNVLHALRYPEPANHLEAKFSIPFCLAVIILKRRAGIQEFTDHLVQEPETRHMMQRVSAHLDPGIEAQGFQRIRSLVQVKLKDGRTLSREASVSRGTPERPMTRPELEEKLAQCAHGIIPEGKAGAIPRLLYRIENVDDLQQLATLLTP